MLLSCLLHIERRQIDAKPGAVYPAEQTGDREGEQGARRGEPRLAQSGRDVLCPSAKPRRPAVPLGAPPRRLCPGELARGGRARQRSRAGVARAWPRARRPRGPRLREPAGMGYRRSRHYRRRRRDGSCLHHAHGRGPSLCARQQRRAPRRRLDRGARTACAPRRRSGRLRFPRRDNGSAAARSGLRYGNIDPR